MISGAVRGVIEAERAFEMLTLGKSLTTRLSIG
jgi:hypothetical protein